MPHGARELAHPETGVYLVGMKSYGRAPTFLAMTGYEQVRSVTAALAGDHDAAARVELTLTNTRHRQARCRPRRSQARRRSERRPHRHSLTTPATPAERTVPCRSGEEPEE